MDIDIVNEDLIVLYAYETSSVKIEGKTLEEATTKFEEWISANTPYRGLTMFAKHKGYSLLMEDRGGNRYIKNGTQNFRIDQSGNLIEEVFLY